MVLPASYSLVVPLEAASPVSSKEKAGKDSIPNANKCRALFVLFSLSLCFLGALGAYFSQQTYFKERGVESREESRTMGVNDGAGNSTIAHRKVHEAKVSTAKQSAIYQGFESSYGAQNLTTFLEQKWTTGPAKRLSAQPLPPGSSYHREKDLSWPHTHERFDALGPVLQCPEDMLISLGRGDGEKRVCGLPNEEALIKKTHCTVISIGSQNRFDFETAVHKKFPSCLIHTLDCTVDRPLVPPSLKGSLFFHKLCLGTETRRAVMNGHNVSFTTWADFAVLIELLEAPVMFKMDVEGFEWSILESMVTSKDASTLPTSIAVELHYQTPMDTLPWYGRLMSPFEMALSMDFLFTRGGYVLVDRHDNRGCKHCSEVVLAKLAERAAPTSPD